MHEEGISKAKDFDPEFIEFIQQNKVKPTPNRSVQPKAKILHQDENNQHITMMDTLKNSSLGDKILMFSKVDQNTEGHAIVQEQREQIKAHERMTKGQKYYQDLLECHQVL